MKILIDTNVVVDVLQQRELWFSDGASIFAAVANRQIVGCLSSKQIADLHFFSRKQFKGQENVDAKARQVIGKLMSLFEAIDTLGMDCQNAMGTNNGDYEDAILMESAVRSGMDCIVTRNLEHFKPSSIPVYTPQEFIQTLNQPE